MIKIGMMSFAHIHAASYANALNESKNIEFVGVADEDTERAKKMAAEYHTQYFASYQELLKQPLDAVIICSENIKHKELTLLAAKAGKHILCEKPIATNVADAREMIDACKKAGVQLMIAFPCRYSPSFQKIKELVASGEVGKIVAIRATNRGQCPGSWFIDPSKSGGGAVIDHTVHVMDLIRDLTGAEPTQVFAEIGNQMFHKEFDDMGLLSINFSNDMFVSLDSSWSRPKTFPTWGDVTMNITGETGTLNLNMFAQNIVNYNDTQNKVAWIPWGDNQDFMMIEDFAKCIEEKKPVPITGEDGLAAVQVAFGAYQSAKTGQPVALPLK